MTRVGSQRHSKKVQIKALVSRKILLIVEKIVEQ